jgi:hypothetical protein
MLATVEAVKLKVHEPGFYNLSTELTSLGFCRSVLYAILYNVLVASNLKYICIAFYIAICFTYCRLAGVYMRNRKHGGKENET